MAYFFQIATKRQHLLEPWQHGFDRFMDLVCCEIMMFVVSVFNATAAYA
jgi:hypothetical protein